MLEQVRKAGFCRLLVLGSNVVPEVDTGDGELVDLLEYDVKTVRKAIGLEIDAGDAASSLFFLAQRSSFLGMV